MAVQPGLCQTWSESTLLIFPRCGSNFIRHKGYNVRWVFWGGFFVVDNFFRIFEIEFLVFCLLYWHSARCGGMLPFAVPWLILNVWNIRICHECEVWIDKSVPRVTVWHHEALPSDAKQWPEGQICRSIPLTNDRFFFLHTFLCKSLNKLQFYLKIRHTFTSAILFWRHFMALLWRALATMLRDVHYNQY